MREYSTTFTEKIKALDIPLIVITLLLSIYGIIVIASATRSFNDSKLLIQIVAVVIGIICMAAISFIDYETIVNKFSIVFFIGSIVLLALTLVIGTGDGNKSWIRIPNFPIGIQPSEFVKLFFILTFSKHLNYIKADINNIKNILALCLHAGIIIGLVIMQGDIGSALIFVFIFFAMCFVAGVSWWYFLSAGVLTILASPIIWNFLKPYQKMRILVGFNPELDPQDFGYQVIRSKNAIKSGGFFGDGYMNGHISQSKNALPAKQTDMIFAVIAEELGFLGALIFFILICSLIIRILYIARLSRKDYGSYICVGIAAVFIVQTIENVGMCLGMLPVIGITLPFMSYGGSSILSLFITIGVVLSIKSHRVKYYFERETS